MIAHELTTGLRIEAARRTIAVVDTSKGTIEISAGRSSRRELAASRAGVRAALDLLVRLAHGRAEQGEPAPRQPDLFGAGPLRSADAFERAQLEELLLAALRRSARARCDVIDQLEAAVAAEQPTPLVFSATALELPYFARDVVRFRAAAIAASCIESVPVASESAECARALFGKLAAWRALFSPTGQVSRALNKTLAELPPGVAAADVWALRALHLERPVRSALHLRVLAQRARGSSQHLAEQASLLQHAEEEELLELRDRAARTLGLVHLDAGQQEHALAELIARAGAPVARDNLRALVLRALVGDRRRRRSYGATNDQTPTRAPPIPAPSGVRFLGTVGEVIREGEEMGHCVGAHAVSAVNGEAFIFHVELDGEHATVEVDQHGRLVEAQGPRNRQNRAAHYGEALLRAWGAGFWVARVGGVERSTWVEPRPDAPAGFVPLRTVAACLAVFHEIASVAGNPAEEIARWFEVHVERAVEGWEWLSVRGGGAGTAVVATDRAGMVVDALVAARTDALTQGAAVPST